MSLKEKYFYSNIYTGEKMVNYYCKWYGQIFSNIITMMGASCQKVLQKA